MTTRPRTVGGSRVMTPEALLPVAFLAGFFGGGHCLGMCGPVVVLLESGSAEGPGWARRFAYNAGRVLFYAVLGAVAGAFGLMLTKIAGIDTGLRVLRWAAALLVIALGLNLLFNLRLLRFLESAGAVIWRKVSPVTRRLLPIRSLTGAVGAGFVWGMLPCGLVYSAAALAASSGSAVTGAGVMLAFWLGTLPALLTAGVSAGRIAGWSRHPSWRRVAGSLMVAVGLVSVGLPVMMMSQHMH